MTAGFKPVAMDDRPCRGSDCADHIRGSARHFEVTRGLRRQTLCAERFGDSLRLFAAAPPYRHRCVRPHRTMRRRHGERKLTGADDQQMTGVFTCEEIRRQCRGRRRAPRGQCVAIQRCLHLSGFAIKQQIACIDRRAPLGGVAGKKGHHLDADAVTRNPCRHDQKRGFAAIGLSDAQHLPVRGLHRVVAVPVAQLPDQNGPVQRGFKRLMSDQCAHRSARLTTACSKMFRPATKFSGVQFSSLLWVMPFLQGVKIIAVGQWVARK